MADWYTAADVALRVVTLVVLSGGLLGTFAVLTSLRANTYSQIYSRFQTMLLKLSDHPEVFDRMKREEFFEGEATTKARFFANAMVNLYEEAFLLHESRVLSIFSTVPDDYWQSMLGSMRAAFQLKYVRTHWEKRQAVFSARFNSFVRDHILPKPNAGDSSTANPTVTGTAS
ncbi:MAG: hypothetical protein ACRCZF_01085 [Gemmataceae bacterium]